MKPLSPPRRVPRLLTLALVMTLSGASYAAEPESCGSAGPGVFNSWGTGGKIAITQQQTPYTSSTATCNVSFTGGGNINVETIGFIEPTWIDTQNNNATKPACSVLGETPKNPKPTGVTLDRITLPTFPTDTRGVDIKYTHPNAFISVGDDPIGDQGQGCLDNASATCRPYQFVSGNKWKLWPNVNSSDPSFTASDGATFPERSGDPLIISNNVENVYDEIYSQAAKLYFKYDGTRPFIINRLNINNYGNTVTFEPGDYYFNDFSFGTTTVLSIAGTGNGTGKVNIFIKNASGSTFVGSGSCLNIQGVDTFEKCVQIRTDMINGTTPALSPPYDLNAQHPEKLAFWLYGGKLKLDDTIFVSASIYNDDPNGEVEFSANNRTTFVGEIVSKNIRTNNQGPVFMHYKDTNVFDELYEEASGTIPSHVGYYQLAPAAHPKRATTGELAFIPYQTDYIDANHKRGGHLQAFAYKTDGATVATPTWDSSVKMGLIGQLSSGMGRMTYLNSNKADGTPVLMSTLGSIGTAFDGSAFGCGMTDTSCKCKAMAASMRSIAGPTVATTSVMGMMGTGCAMMSGALNLQFPSLASEWNTIHGLPNGSKPLIYKNKVLFTSSDGYLYAVDRQTGVMDWGWIPRPLLTGLFEYSKFLMSDPMQGQLVGIPTEGLLEDPNSVNKSGTILGTAKGGALHYALSLDTTGKISDVLWMDARKASDTGTSGTASVYADLTATSPNAAEQVFFGNTTLYIVNNRIITRDIDDGGSANSIAPATGITLTSTPLVALSNRKDIGNQSILYVGDSKGDIYTLDLSANNPSWNAAVRLANFGEAAPIEYLTYTRKGDYEYLTAQSDTRLTVFKRLIPDAVSPANNDWVQAWRSDDSGSQAASVDYVQTIPATATFSARVSVAGGVVSAPVSVYNATTCLADGYSYFFNLDNGKFPMGKVKYLGTVAVETNKLLGSGIATESTIKAFNGKLSIQGQSSQNVGALNADGTTTKADGADDRFEIVGNVLIERRGWREIFD